MSYDLTIPQLRGTAAQLTATNATPASGRLCIETDTGKAKVGNGSTAYRSLSYITLSGEERSKADDVDTSATVVSSEYLEYIALLSDPSDEISATVLKNELAGAVVWEEGANPGEHTGTLAGAFPSGRTVVLIGGGAVAAFSGVIPVINAGRLNDNTIQVLTGDTSNGPAGEMLNQTAIIIRVYPA